MFEEPKEDPSERAIDPAARAKDKSDEFRMHAELAAVFEAPRKFDARVIAGLDPQLARDIQRSIGKMEKSRSVESPILPEASVAAAAEILNFANAHSLPPHDYHIHRRPGEVMIVRWLYGEQVDTFYERLQAHFDAAMTGFKEDERQAHEWKQDPKTLAFFAALDASDVKMADRYLRDPIRKHSLFVLSTQAADEMNIAYLCNDVMGVSTADVVGNNSAPPEAPAERDLARFFKLFSLRGMAEGMEQMCFFTFLQKVDDSADSDW